MKFLIFKCGGAQELCREAIKAGFHGTWLPMEQVEVLRTPKNRAPYIEEVVRPAVYGYVYVPKQYERDFQNWVPEKYGAKPVLSYYGKPGITKLLHNLFIRPAEVDLTELRDHAVASQQLRRLILTQTPVADEPEEPKYEFKRGDNVHIRMSCGNVIEGTIYSFKSSSRVRIRTNAQFIDADIDELQII